MALNSSSTNYLPEGGVFLFYLTACSSQRVPVLLTLSEIRRQGAWITGHQQVYWSRWIQLQENVLTTDVLLCPLGTYFR